MKEFHSIFNHALAPITPGPSSSNTCGPVRIGMMASYILGSLPKEAAVEYYSKGAFVTSLYGMRSDYAFINGLLGKEQNTPDFLEAYKKAEEAGMKVIFRQVDDLTIGGMETVRIRMKAEDGFEISMIGESVGGGAILVHYVEDCPVRMQGTDHELMIFTKKPGQEAAEALEKEIAAKTEKLNASASYTGEKYSIVNIKAGTDFNPAFLDEVKAMEEVAFIRVAQPLHPIVTDVSRVLPFETPDEMIAYCEKNQCTPAKAAIEYEKAVSGWEEKKVREYCDMLISIMRDSRTNGFKKDLKFEGIVSAKGAELNGKIGNNGMPSLGVLNKAIPAALGIMEHSNASGKIVCVPTGGSSGIVPALLLAAAEDMNISEDALYESMMVAGIIGVLMMVDGNEFAGGTHGCQAEIACGTAMAAAGLVQMMGGTAKQALDAASMSLQSFLGLICDPVAGLVQVPCLARNIAGVSVAASCAESVCAGFDVVIPLDEMSRIMVRIGGTIANTLGMCCSGCCLTPTGIRLMREYEARRQNKQ